MTRRAAAGAIAVGAAAGFSFIGGSDYISALGGSPTLQDVYGGSSVLAPGIALVVIPGLRAASARRI